MIEAIPQPTTTRKIAYPITRITAMLSLTKLRNRTSEPHNRKVRDSGLYFSEVGVRTKLDFDPNQNFNHYLGNLSLGKCGAS